MLLGALMLVVTGGEAMYADLGHFGALPIRLSWYVVVFPALLLNYLGQGAFFSAARRSPGDKLFYALAPEWLLAPMVVLATAATVIASQSLISGAFSLVSQAIRLGLFPRLDIEHTHHAHEGQVYIPAVNWALLIGCVALVVGFGSSSALAAAYGLAVAGVMVITSVAMIPIALRHWGWSARADRARLGSADGAERRLLRREPPEALRGRLRADRRRRGRLRHDGDLALGPQGDLRRPQRQGDADHVRGRHAAPGEPLLSSSATR